MACGSEFMLQLKEAASKEPGVYGNPPWDKDTVLSTDGFAWMARKIISDCYIEGKKT